LGILEAGDKPVFEINTGAMAKGYRTSPYPAADQMKYIRNKGGILIYSSDSHSVDTVGYGFE
jgi:histidinol-phosphatase (PHP family)